ncbi:imidazole glycerol phosphate synthase subunit HisF [Candidatus Woesearchaeota archaeon]|nr:imidazole glycerol phosphate synthase subunit HisF [Candidatus Woesearchaeota archaeon]
MLTKRIIPCLDVNNGQTVKGTGFVNLRYAGDPVKLARKYYDEGADEIVLLDITASSKERKTMIDVVEKVAKQIFIPFTVGGGIRTIEDIRALLNAGADKVSINTAAVKNPDLIKEASAIFGSQCIVVAIDAKKTAGRWQVFINGGKDITALEVMPWAKKMQLLGAGEILLTSIDQDGTKKGYDLALVRQIAEAVTIPVIASGGVGSLPDILEGFTKGKADAALVASLFHYNAYTVREVKEYLQGNGIEVVL